MRAVLVVFVSLAGAVPASADHPTAVLRADGLAVTVNLPDAEKGYYRGTRFDWAGVIGPVEFAGHKLFGPWKDKHNPMHNDDIVGPVDEFGMESPLGYDEAGVGDTFVKIGVGELVKPKEEKYRFYFNYKIARPGVWQVKTAEGRVTFAQDFAANGYGYRYEKAVSVGPGPVLRIEYALKNTGTKPIVTDVYNHNFLNVDADPVGPNYEFAFPFPVTPKDAKERFPEVCEVGGNEVRFRRPLDQGSVWTELTGFDADTVPGYTFRHKPSGITLTVRGTGGPLKKYAFWGMKSTICPEPFLAVTLKPGDDKRWAWEYEFSKSEAPASP